MSLFDLQDVCIAIGSIATLDLPMVVDLIGIYGLKGPYCMLTTTDWFLQALSVIPRGSWGDVARRFTMIRWADHNIQFRKLSRSVRSDRRSELRLSLGGGDELNVHCWTRARWAAASPPLYTRRLAPPPRVAGICFGRFDKENPFVQNSSVLLVQPDEGVSVMVVDRIGDYLPQSTEKSRVLVIPVGARHKCQQELRHQNFEERPTAAAACGGTLPPAARACASGTMRAGRAWREEDGASVAQGGAISCASLHNC
ncbi:hypothetical protein F511_05660 [Dorcoceras hygrometricum]|uniref:Acyl-CoA dehydrogenase-related protein n=1 Tax=Dorcoceras hygrometricum TaxID=472368 RepID=A0A2Z7BZX4_9LAMI|nr:hypothetical protein F511_05660 [Dorcoceras hygrometricum]